MKPAEDFECPQCDAKPGQRCRTETGSLYVGFHVERWRVVQTESDRKNDDVSEATARNLTTFKSAVATKFVSNSLSFLCTDLRGMFTPSAHRPRLPSRLRFRALRRSHLESCKAEVQTRGLRAQLDNNST